MTNGTAPLPRKIAFVAMPFGTKPTSLSVDKGPPNVDFDKLWDRAIAPALEKLDYLPVRADNQSGSIIVKDMLEQLVCADLVLADISIPNGNVYYEAGVRHAAKSTGCVLMGADWTEPLFDLKQFRQIRYPFGKVKPGDDIYQEINEHLVEAIPPLVDSLGPVHSLTAIGTEQSDRSRLLRESSEIVSSFETRLRAARLRAENDDASLVQELLRRYNDTVNLPNYVSVELLILVRDTLGWNQVTELIDRFPDNLRKEHYVREQAALAKAYAGKPMIAIAEIEQLIDEQGKTPERLGLIGGRYKRLYRDEKDPVKQRRWLSKAIDAYKEGAQLDLNEYFCACNLPGLYRARNARSDLKRAETVSAQVVTSCERARQLELGDEWLEPTLLGNAFDAQDLDKATELVEEIFTGDQSKWKLETSIDDLNNSLEYVTDTSIKAEFENLVDRLTQLISVPKSKLVSEVLPMIRSRGKHCIKKSQVEARPAEPGERIVSITSDGPETANVAKPGDYVVRNATRSEELYIVSEVTFSKRYDLLEKIDDTWSRYQGKGEVMALEIDDQVLAVIGKNDSFHIMAPWDSSQRANKGDFLVSTMPDLDEIYRIGRQEFEETYQIKN